MWAGASDKQAVLFQCRTGYRAGKTTTGPPDGRNVKFNIANFTPPVGHTHSFKVHVCNFCHLYTCCCYGAMWWVKVHEFDLMHHDCSLN